MQYEQIVAEDCKRLLGISNSPKSVYSVYECLKEFPVLNSSVASKNVGLSFNSVSKAMYILQGHGFITQMGDSSRNKIWVHSLLADVFTCTNE